MLLLLVHFAKDILRERHIAIYYKFNLTQQHIFSGSNCHQICGEFIGSVNSPRSINEMRYSGSFLGANTTHQFKMEVHHPQEILLQVLIDQNGMVTHSKGLSRVRTNDCLTHATINHLKILLRGQ